MNATRALLALAAGTVLVLAGCTSSTQPVPPCCYQGTVTTTRLAALEAVASDGRRLRFADIFPGYVPQEGLVLRPLPFNEVQQQEIIYASLEPLLPLYDANGDGRLEKPEVLVMYAREAALATGTPIKHFGTDTPIWAVSAPTADVGGLVGWVQAQRGVMTEAGQALFSDLDLLGQDLKLLHNEGGVDRGGFYDIR